MPDPVYKCRVLLRCLRWGEHNESFVLPQPEPWEHPRGTCPTFALEGVTVQCCQELSAVFGIAWHGAARISSGSRGWLRGLWRSAKALDTLSICNDISPCCCWKGWKGMDLIKAQPSSPEKIQLCHILVSSAIRPLKHCYQHSMSGGTQLSGEGKGNKQELALI